MEKEELLIGKWFPVVEVSVESVRERSTGHNPPTSRIHVWFARRPHTASRAAIIGSLLPAKAKREVALKLLGIPIGVDVRKAEEEVARAKAAGKRLNHNPFSWKKAFKHTPSETELSDLHTLLNDYWAVERPNIVDPMAGGGSIPYEAMRLGLPVVAGDLNPVAYVCLKGTLEYPARFRGALLPALETFCREIHEAAKAELEEFFPEQPGDKIYAYLWAGTIKCSSCGLIIPLSPNWWIVRTGNDRQNIAARLTTLKTSDISGFEITNNPKAHGLDPDKGTVKGGRAECPRCHTVIDGEEIKREAQSGRMGHQLYCVCVKTKGRGKTKLTWHYRPPTKGEHEAIAKAETKLKEKLPVWETKGLLPTESFPETANDTRPIQYGMPRWRDLFNPRQLLTHLTYLEKFDEAKKRIIAGRERGTEEWEFAAAVMTYGAMVFDTCVDYDSLLGRWDPTREKIANSMSLQAFPFKWSYAEWNQLVPDGGYEWALSKVLDALKEIIELLPEKTMKPTVYCGSAARIPLEDKSVPCIVVDPPYAENVMYAEISDFFYVWLKRLIGDIYPEPFKTTLTEKEEEAVANPARFKNMGTSAKKLAQEDYKTKMEACFKEMHRVLQDDGVMTVMFTHRTAEAWSGLATALMNANFTFISSWPVHTEPEKFAKMGKGVLKVTVLLTCRKRKANHPGIWEHIVEELRDVAKRRIEEFGNLGIGGPDLRVSVYGPVLGRFADYHPVKTATGREIDLQETLALVTELLNERFLQEAGIQNADRETAAYINLISAFPAAETEYEEARLATVFGGLVTLDTLDVKGSYGLIEKDGKSIKILSARDRQARGIIDPHNNKTLKTTIDHVHAAILLYEYGGLMKVKELLTDRNLDSAGSPFLSVLHAYARYADNSTNDNFKKDAAVAKALLTALGKTIELGPRKEERIDHYFESA